MKRLLARLDELKSSASGSGLFTLFRILISGGLIAAAICLAHPRKIWDVLMAMESWPLVMACFLFAIVQVLTALRWQVVLRSLHGDPPGIWYLNGLYHIGMFFNFFLPSTVGGDVVRAEMAKSHSGGRTGSYAAVLFDRFSAFIAVVLIGTVALVYSYAGIGWFDWQVALLGLLFVLVSVLAFVVLETSFADRLLHRLSRGHLVRLLAALRNGLAMLQACAADKPMLVLIVVLSLLIQIMAIFVVYLLGIGLGLEVGILFYFVAIPIIILVTLLPISLNGLGVREVMFVVLYAKVGVPSEMALALSFSLTLIFVLFALFGGLCLQFPSIYRYFEDRSEQCEPGLGRQSRPHL
jgi:glycosyltransferase 2 family protein